MSVDVIDLLHSVEAPPMTVDPRQAMADGRRDRARRRLVLGAAAAVVLAAVAVGIQLTDHDDQLPATPANAVRMEIQPGSAGQVPDYSLWAAPVADPPSMLVTAEDSSGTVIAARTVNLSPDGLGFARLEPRGVTLLVLVGPGPGALIAVPTPQRDVQSWSGRASLASGAQSALALPLLPGDDGGEVRAVYTSVRGRGGVFSDGSAVATAHVGGAILWLNRTHRITGYESAGSAGMGDLGASPGEGSGYLNKQGLSRGVKDEAVVLEATGELPVGATDVRVASTGTVPQGVTIGATPYSDGRSVAVYLVRTVTSDGVTEPEWAPVTGIRWKDATGAEHTTPLS